VTFVEPDGSPHVVDAEVGEMLSTVAVSSLVKGVIGECGGGLSCATCHIFIDEEWSRVVGAPGDDESGMLEMTAVAATDRSRLSCQIIVSEELSGLVVHVPERQE
jgi:2Fe-2S ferredoxin